MTGMSAWSYRALKQALGISDAVVRVHDLYQMLAEVQPVVLDALGCDFVMLPMDSLALGASYGTWKPFTFWDGQTFDVPADFCPSATPDGGLETHQNRGGETNMRMPHGGRFFDLMPSKRQDIFATPHLAREDWSFAEPFPDEFLRAEQSKARALFESTDKSIVASPPVGAPQGYGDTYFWAMKMLSEPAYCLDYMMHAGEAAAVCFGQYMQAVGDYVDTVVISGNDYGTQDREMFRPELWRDFYMPAWQPITDTIHATSKAKAWMHCCGSVYHMIQYFVGAGVDCLNPIQWTAGNMGLERLKREFGDDLVFWGGAISTQRTFPFGTAADVAQEAAKILDVMAPGGGFVVNPIHNVLPEVPVENIVSLYHTARDYRYA